MRMKRLVLLFVFLVTMSRIDYAIPSQAYELIRDRIGEILTDEVANQIDLSYDVDLNAVVLIEDRDPIDKVQLNAIVVSLATGQYSNKNQGSSVDGGYLYFIDIYTNAKERFNKSGSYRAATIAHKLSRYVRCILEHQEYKTLGYQPGFVMRTGFVEFNIRDVSPSTDSLSTYMIRMVFKVDANEITNAKVPNLIEGYDTLVDVIYQYEGNTDNNPDEPCECEMTADFSVSSQTPTVGDTITFTDETDNYPTSWVWKLTQGAVITRLFTQNPSVTVNTVGTMDVELIAAKDGAGDIVAKSAYIVVGAPPYEPEAIDLFERMDLVSESPSATRKNLINDVFVGLKVDHSLDLGDQNIDTLGDCLWVPAAHGELSARLNWINTNFTLVPINGPTHTVDKGYTCNGINQYFKTNYNLSVHAASVGRDNLTIGSYVRQNNASGATIGAFNNVQNVYTYIYPRDFSDRLTSDVNDASSGILTSISDARGFTFAQRNLSTEYKVYRGSTLVNTPSNSSTGLLNAPITLMATNNNNDVFPTNLCNNEIAMATILSGNVIISSLYDRLNTYLTAIGASV